MYDKRTRERTTRYKDIDNEVVCMIKGQEKGQLVIKTTRYKDIDNEVVCMIKGQEKGQLVIKTSIMK